MSKTLLGCGCDPEKIIPWDTFSEQIQRYSRLGVLATIGCLAVLTADASEVKGDIHSDDVKVGLFTDTAKIRNPETLRRLTERLNGVIQDAVRLGHI